MKDAQPNKSPVFSYVFSYDNLVCGNKHVEYNTIYIYLFPHVP